MARRAPTVQRGSPWRKVAVTGFVALLVLIGIALYVYLYVGDLGLSTNGYIALVLGAVGTAVVMVGLMSLVFFSHRQGYDDEAGERFNLSETGHDAQSKAYREPGRDGRVRRF